MKGAERYCRLARKMVTEKKKCSYIGTHNGQFHCDEALACYMLKLLPEFENFQIRRTRDPALLDDCDIVVDVGAIYDHSKLRYDHHQRDFKVTMKDIKPEMSFTTKLSSAGLVYAHYGFEILKRIYAKDSGLEAMSDNQVKQLYQKVYENFVEEIDAVDNGISVSDSEKMNYKVTSTISNRVGFLNPKWNEESSENISYTKFEQAMKLVGSEFESRALYYAKVWLPGRDIVEKAMENRTSIHESGKIVVFDDICPPWKDHLFNLEAELSLSENSRILYVLYQDSTNGSWRIQCVPVAEGSFTSRLPLPEAWRGVRDQKLSELTGIDGCVFVHSSGFIGGNATYDGVMKMAVKSLEELNN